MGYVYVIKPKHKDGPVKIGMTEGNIERRLDVLQTAHYEELEVVCLVSTETPKALEAEIHRRFRPQRIRGEWFASSRALLDFFMALTGVHSPLITAKGDRRRPSLPSRWWH